MKQKFLRLFVGFLALVTLSHGEIWDVVLAGDPVLRAIAVPYTTDQIMSNATQQFAADLVETMYSAGGVGLAAPQVGVSQRMFVVACNRSGIVPPLEPTVFLNPALDYSASYGEMKVNLFEGTTLICVFF